MRKELDEYLESLWYVNERNQGETYLETLMGSDFDAPCMEELISRGFVHPSKTPGEYDFTPKGKAYTTRLIRAHRLAERLLNDVLGIEDFEIGACEFEHIMNESVLDSICTLLGHPRTCPHGYPIPPGDCCDRKETSISSLIRPLSDFLPGDEVQIAYVYSENNRQLHILENMQIRPGSTIRIHQTSPTFVIDCEGGSIAIDDQIASDIRAWSPETPPSTDHRRHENSRFHHRGGRRRMQRRNSKRCPVDE